MEYTRFGKGWVQRNNPSDEWSQIAISKVPKEAKERPSGTYETE